jgi:DNA-directed RNA polymerase specialized sigma24 family protein
MTIFEVAELNYKKLVNSALQVVSDPDIAKEAVHEAVLKVHEKEQNGEFINDYPLTYLMVACKNTALDMFVRKPVKKITGFGVDDLENYDRIDENEYIDKMDIFFKVCIVYLEENTKPIDVAIFKYRYYSKLSVADMAKLSGFSKYMIRKSLANTHELLKTNFNYDFYVNRI